MYYGSLKDPAWSGAKTESALGSRLLNLKISALIPKLHGILKAIRQNFRSTQYTSLSERVQSAKIVFDIGRKFIRFGLPSKCNSLLWNSWRRLRRKYFLTKHPFNKIQSGPKVLPIQIWLWLFLYHNVWNGLSDFCVLRTVLQSQRQMLLHMFQPVLKYPKVLTKISNFLKKNPSPMTLGPSCNICKWIPIQRKSRCWCNYIFVLWIKAVSV